MISKHKINIPGGITYTGPDGNLDDGIDRQIIKPGDSLDRNPAMKLPDNPPQQTTKLSIMEQLIFTAEIRMMKDIDAIRAGLERIGIDTRTKNNDEIVDIGHLCRLRLITATETEKRESLEHLSKRGIYSNAQLQKTDSIHLQK